MISLARLDNIALTQTDRNEVARAKQRLAKVTYAKTGKKNKKTEFTFIVNDNRTYTSLNDFRKPEAKNVPGNEKMQSDLETLENELDKLREKYSKSNKAVRESMTPGILDKEKG